MDSHLLPIKKFIATAAAVIILVIVQLLAADAFQLSSRQPWMDEIHTLELVGDPDTGHMLDALADGADFNPPGYYLIARFVTRIVGSSDPQVLRVFSVLCIVAGLTAIGVALQRHVGFTVSIAVVAALWSQTLLVDQSLEARFYAPWFGALAWLCLLMERERQTVISIIGSCCLAMIVCSIHYFGVISLMLVVGGLVLRRWNCIREPGIWLPTACGLVVIASCYRFYSGQKAALTMSTWISPPNAERIWGFFSELIPVAAVGIAIAAAIANRILSKDNDENAESAPANSSDVLPGLDHQGSCGSDNNRGLDSPRSRYPKVAAVSKPNPPDPSFLPRYSGSLGLLLLPVVLLVFSFTVQPALVPRYSLVFLIGCAPLLAWLLHKVKMSVLIPVTLSFLVLGTIRTSGLREQLVRLDQSRTQLVKLLQKHAAGQPVAFENRVDSFPMVRLGGASASNWYLVDFDASALAEPSALRIVQRDVARRFAKWYPKYKTVPLEELRIRERFFVVPYPDRATDDIAYGPFQSRKVADRLYEMQRQ